MKKLIAILFALSILSGCATTTTCPPVDVKPSVVKEYHYVVSPIPDADLVIPPQVPALDLVSATQKTVSDWLAQSEGRSLDMETKLKNIGQIQADQIKAAKQQNGN